MSGLKARLRTHELRHAIVLETRQAGTDEITEEELKPAGFTVTVRRPKGKDMRLIDKFGQDEPIALTIAMVARLSNLDEIEAENLDAEDLEELGNLAMPSAQSGRKTGASA